MAIKNYKAAPYSCYDQYTTICKSDNVSSVIDRMIRVTAKVTENFASDIVYDVQALNKAVEEKEDLKRLISFRENGVSTKLVESFENIELDNDSAFLTSAIQLWELEHSATDSTTKFERVYMREIDPRER